MLAVIGWRASHIPHLPPPTWLTLCLCQIISQIPRRSKGYRQRNISGLPSKIIPWVPRCNAEATRAIYAQLGSRSVRGPPLSTRDLRPRSLHRGLPGTIGCSRGCVRVVCNVGTIQFLVKNNILIYTGATLIQPISTTRTQVFGHESEPPLSSVAKIRTLCGTIMDLFRTFRYANIIGSLMRPLTFHDSHS